MTKFFVGSGCWPLKMRNAKPATKAAKISHFIEGGVLEAAQHLVRCAGGGAFCGKRARA